MKFIYFDIGNTFHLSSTEYTTASIDFGFSLDDIRQIHDELESDMFLGKVTIPQFWQVCQQRLKIVNGADYNFLSSWVSDFHNIDSMHQLAKDLSSTYSIGILSNHFLDIFPEMLVQHKVPNLPYQSIIISCDVGIRKPDLSIYQLATTRAGVAPSEILFVDDKTENLVVPQSLGWQTFLFDHQNPQESVKNIRTLIEL